MSYQATGRIVKITPPENKSKGERPFMVAAIVLELEGRYPQYPEFQFTQERSDLVSNFKERQEVVIEFDLHGREWEGRYFTQLNAWRIQHANPEQAPTPAPASIFNAAEPESAPATDNIGADADGKWYWYQHRPIAYTLCMYWGGVDPGTRYALAAYARPNERWESTLKPRPDLSNIQNQQP